MTEIHISV